jgi:hypothetical protein
VLDVSLGQQDDQIWQPMFHCSNEGKERDEQVDYAQAMYHYKYRITWYQFVEKLREVMNLLDLFPSLYASEQFPFIANNANPPSNP